MPKISSGQRLLSNVLTDYGFGPIILEWPFAGYSIDLYLKRHHVGIEYDGLFHILKGLKDQIRQAEIEKQGLPILRVTSDELKLAKSSADRMQELIDKVAGFVERRGKSDVKPRD